MSEIIPIGIGDLFHEEDSDNEMDTKTSVHSSNTFEQQFETLTVLINNESLLIRQYSFHPVNANAVWPGTNVLGQFIVNQKPYFSNANILELGSATGALAIYLIKYPRCYNIFTCDYDDSNIDTPVGDIEQNIAYNFEINGLTNSNCHIPYTWGQNWNATIHSKTIEKNLPANYLKFKYIIAADILLYVKSYSALVNTLVQLFEDTDVSEFVMSWQRRINESKIFFELMKDASFSCLNHGKGLYTFTRSKM